MWNMACVFECWVLPQRVDPCHRRRSQYRSPCLHLPPHYRHFRPLHHPLSKHTLFRWLSSQRTDIYFAFSFAQAWSSSFPHNNSIWLTHNQTGKTQLILVIESRYNDRKRENVNEKMWAAMIQRWVWDLEDRRNVLCISSDLSSWWSHWRVYDIAAACYATLFSVVGYTDITDMFFGEYRWVNTTWRQLLACCSQLRAVKTVLFITIFMELLFAKHKRRNLTQMCEPAHHQAD